MTKTEEDNFLSIFCKPIKFSFFLLIVPWKPFETEKKSYVFIARKILVFTLTIPSTVWFLYDVYRLVPKNTHSPVSYFNYLLQTTFVVQRCLMIKLIWWDYKRIQEVSTELQKIPISLQAVISISNFWKIFLITWTCIFYAISAVGEVYREYNQICNESLKFLVVLRLIACCHSILTQCFGTVVMMSSICMLRLCVKTFQNYLAESQSIKETKREIYLWRDIRAQINWLKCVTKRVNNLVGYLLSVYVMANVLYFAIGMDRVVLSTKTNPTDTNYIRAVQFVLYMVTSLIFFYICPDVVLQMGSFREWLTVPENMNLVESPKELAMMVSELDSSFISVKANGQFPLTPGFVASVSCVIELYQHFCYISQH